MVKYITLSSMAFCFFSISLSIQSCQFDASKVKIERFEFLDEKTRDDDFKDERLKHLNNQLISKAYIVHGYKKKYDLEINHIIDQYLCDSVLPDLYFGEKLYIEFFKASSNTNQERIMEIFKHRRIHARSHDLLLHFLLFHPNDSTIWITKQKAGLWKPNPPSEKFYCE